MPDHFIQNLSEAIAEKYNCRCIHFGTEHVRIEHEGKEVWEGDVEIFQLEGHSDSKVVYGWAWSDDNDDVHYVGVLQKPSVDAVKVAISSGEF